MVHKMLRVVLIIGVLSLITIGPATAQNSLEMGAMGLSVSVADEDFVLSGRYLLNPTLAALAEFGFQAVDNSNSGTNFTFGGGVRKYLSAIADLVPFVGANLAFVRAFHLATDDTESGIKLNAVAGAEYFIMSQLSVEAEVGIELNTVTGGEDVTTFGTTRSSVGVTFYLP